MEIIKKYAKNFKRFGQKRTSTLDSIEIHSIGTAQNTAKSHPSAFKSPIAFNSCNSVLAAGGAVAAAGLFIRTDLPPVKADHGKQNSFHHVVSF